jgi:drug/metabolite transporter, DME family
VTRAAGQAGRGTACVLAASVLWGTTGTAATFAPAVGPLAIGAAAMGVGGLLQAVTAAGPMTRQRAVLRAQWRLVALGGVAVAVFPMAFYTSMRVAGVAVGTVVSIGTAPLASALAERVLDHHRLTARWMSGAALGLAGIVALCLAQAGGPHSGRASGWLTILGVGLGLAAGMTYAIYSWAAHRLIGRGVTARAAMGSVFGLGGLLLLPVLLATGAPLAASWASAAVGGYMAVIPMFTGYLLFGWALARISASTATTLSLLEPAVAVILAVTVVGERLPAAGWAGLVLIAGCLIVLTAPLPRDLPGHCSGKPAGHSLPHGATTQNASTAVTLLRVCLGRVAKSGQATCRGGRPIRPVYRDQRAGVSTARRRSGYSPPLSREQTEKEPRPCGLTKIINADASPGFAARR